MKKLLFVCLLILSAGVVWADMVTLTTPESVASPVAPKIEFNVAEINAATKTIRVQYRWINPDGTPIVLNNRAGWLSWYGRDINDDPETPQDETDTTFSDIFLFQIRAQDVGTPIGKGLRTLIWNQMKGDILTPGNDGTFGD